MAITRDSFSADLKNNGTRNDPIHHNFMMVGQVLFDIQDKLDELLKRTEDLYHSTPIEGPKFKSLKIAPLTPKEEETPEKPNTPL